MSEEINLNVNNLSTTAEAFELFQASSMNSEDGFVTLSDNPCPQPFAVDVMTPLHEMSSEKEIGSSTNIDVQSELTYCDLEVGSEVNITEDDAYRLAPTSKLESESNTHLNYTHEINDLVENSSADNKSSDLDLNVEYADNTKEGEPTEIETISNSEFQPPITAGKKGRGRGRGRGRMRGRGRGRSRGRSLRSLNCSNTTVTDVETDVSNECNQIVAKTLETANNDLHLSTVENYSTELPMLTIDKPTEEIPLATKRGTRRKNESPVDSSFVDRSDSDISPKVPRKRGRPRKDNSIQNVTIEILPTFNGDKSSSNLNGSEIKDLPNIVECSAQMEDNLSEMEGNLTKIENLYDNDSDEEDICLSKLKTTIDTDNCISKPKDPILEELQSIPSSPLHDTNKGNDNPTAGSPLFKEEIIISSFSTTPPPQPSPAPIIEKEDDVVTEKNENHEEISENLNVDLSESLLVEDVSKRPQRRKAKTALKYKNDDDSDEDPFANVELSDDDEPKRRKKSGRYQSDDEYVPGLEGGRRSSIDSSDSAVGDTLEELKQQTRKRGRKKQKFQLDSANASPQKNVKSNDIDNVKEPWRFSPDVQNVSDDDNVDGGTQSSVTKPVQPPNAWGTSNEFENFLAKKIQGTNLKIKKLKPTKSSPNALAPLEIPVLDANEVKKRINIAAQTNIAHTATTSTQTSGPGTLSMQTNIPLSTMQSEKACEFLKSIVKTTSDLGQLMTQKSEDFIKKKINMSNVVDTFKMDYCVKKSFLLLKLAKHNLLQMEEDLASQYEKFLKDNELLSYREQEKKLVPKKEADSDSDCEIIEETSSNQSTSVKQKESKPKFNPKTVFLNKELSIKIAKKPSEGVKSNKNINIKGRHTVWINDSVMVKKVKSQQSFLAQDSRNKKPPDSKITAKMVSEFFEDYYRQKAVQVCTPFVSTEWFCVQKTYVCNYFSVEPDKLTSDNISRTDEIFTNTVNNPTVSESSNGLSEKTICEVTKLRNPSTLFSICLKNMQQQLLVVSDSSDANSFPGLREINPNVGKSRQPKTLLSLCLENLTKKEVKDVVTLSNTQAPTPYNNCLFIDNKEEHKYQKDNLFSNHNQDLPHQVPSLKFLCYKGISKLYYVIEKTVKKTNSNRVCASKISDCENNMKAYNIPPCVQPLNSFKNVKSLSTFCVELIQKSQESFLPEATICEMRDVCPSTNKISFSPISLKLIAFEYLKCLLSNNCSSEKRYNLPQNVNNRTLNKLKTLAEICFDTVSIFFKDYDSSSENEDTTHVVELTINAINTLSEEAYLNIEETCASDHDNSDFYENDGDNMYEDGLLELDSNNLETDIHTENDSWVSQLKFQEQKSLFVSNNSKKGFKSTSDNEDSNVTPENYPLIAHVKTEPELEEPLAIGDNFSSVVKTEPNHDLDQMTIIPESVVTKKECSENVDPLPVGRDLIQRQNSTSFDEDSFEAFVSANKMIRALSDSGNNNEETFSQSALRVRRQHEPDSDNENDTSMSLLVPHAFEPLNIESAKGSLLENSSSDCENSGKKNTKRKPITRRKTRKPEPFKQNSKDMLPKEKPVAVNEVAILTRRMREKIRQEEKKVESSESDSESASQISKGEKEPKKTTSTTRTPVKNTRSVDNEIQCNNVDSTEQLADLNISKLNLNNEDNNKDNNKDINKFTGFSAVDQNEISTYHKYVKYVYDQILPKVDEESQSNNTKETTDKKDELIVNGKESSQIICPDEPIELLECTPTMPIFDDVEVKRKPAKMEIKLPSTIKESKDTKKDSEDNNTKTIEASVEEAGEKVGNFIDRYGWECYPIKSSDTKLYQEVIVPIEKLPESFVETYFEYQEITDKTQEDAEIDRLTNLQSLNRCSTVSKTKCKNRDKTPLDKQVKSTENNPTRPFSPVDTADYNELTPSEDEGANYDDDFPQSVPVDTSENHLAKNSLMNDDYDSDTPLSKRKTPTKQEPDGDMLGGRRNTKIGPKSKMVEVKHEHSDLLMLTADKMMNKELTLLHAPVVLDDKNNQTPTKGPVTRNKQRSATKNYRDKANRIKSDDSSSEEEKLWVNTKEKLLKRLGKKQESTMDDDAKRAKLVSEFIEKRNDKPDVRKTRGRSKRSRRKLLERQKQMRVLTHELLGDASSHIGKGKSQAYFKGRRNIRKVIDKKSLARSTVIANMEEFERKRRLSLKQIRLQELMGCDEGVNVVVINDEVCLEYDFEELRPAVTVHPFFTKVMKAHQYEGVKFMWDACFESLQNVESGHQGGGCILAHCMGLGKTLQVLALLHTVLTHPRVGMHRVLVCCPLSTVLNWVDEIHKWIGPVTDEIKVFELSKLKKTYERAYQLEDWYNGGGIFIIGYELFRSLTTLDAELDDIRQTIIDKIRSALLDPGPDIIICDEGHLLKNDSSVLAVAMSRVATRRRIVLTGTPMQNNLREYYCMVNFVKPNLLGTYAEYSNRFENPIMNGQHRDSQAEDIKLMKARTHILHKVLEGCLQRQEASVLYPYLPKKHEYTVFISLTKCQCDLYKHYLQCYANKQKQSILKDFHTLQKIWSHPQVLHDFQMKSRDEKIKLKAEKLEDDLAREDLTATEDMKPSNTEVWWLQHLEGGNMLECLESSNKFVAVFRILQESIALGDKVLIFSTSLITMDVLEHFLKKINNWSLGQDYYRLDGSVPPEVRQKWVREFNAEHNYKTKLFLISTRAGSLGLNMTAANRVIILDTSWNPAHDIQSIFRVYRFGQKKDCYIYRLVALGTMEQKIYERAVTKQAVSCRVVDEQQIDRHYNMAELTELYRFDETGVGVAGGVAVGVQDVVLLRVARDSALHAVHEHDSLLRGSEPALPEHERAAAWQQFQQETERNQMKTDDELVKNKKIAKRSLSVDKPAATTVVKEEARDDRAAPAPEPRSKRGRKAVTCCIPIQPTPQPSTSQQPDDFFIDKNQEKDMVSKITRILLSHDFNNKKGSRDITKLIGNVRQIVASGDLSKLPPGDDLAASIAQVLLRKEAPQMPSLTDVRSLSVALVPRPEEKKSEQLNDDTISETITGDLNVKTRRKAAVTAGKKLDSISPDIVIDLNDGEWRGGSDTDSAPDLPKGAPEPVKPKYKLGPDERRGGSDTDSASDLPKGAPEPVKPKYKLGPGERRGGSDTDSAPDVRKEAVKPKYKPGPKSKKEQKRPRKQIIEPVEPAIAVDDSILLSDEEVAPKVAPTVTVKDEADASNKTDDGGDSERYPLHPSLLTNKNFVKIVAHTYLAGNPMLDEDAATLAARYSTSKALRELEATGKSIDSGPIYDIAVKVLGTEILQKLHTSGNNSISAATAREQKALSEKMLSEASTAEDRPKLKVKVTSELMPKAKPKPKIPNLGFVKLTPVAPPVVPVGLIKRAVPVASPGPQFGDECILPDDDDVRIVSPPAPARAGPASRTREPPPLVINNVKSQKSSTPEDRLASITSTPPALENRPVIKICGNRIIAVGPDAAPPAKPDARPQADTSTICLDSDDEEPLPPAPPLIPPRESVVQTHQPSPIKHTNIQPVESIPPRNLNYYDRPPPPQMTLAGQNVAPPQIFPPEDAPAQILLPAREHTTRCRPGDVIRISKSGQIELLNQIAPVDFPSRVTKDRAGRASRNPANTSAPVPEPDGKIPKPAERVRVISSSSGSSSRSASPDDPLSILRDVVHIPADRYQSPRARNTPLSSPNPGPSKAPASTVVKPPDPPKLLAPKKPAAEANPNSILIKPLKPKEPLKKMVTKESPMFHKVTKTLAVVGKTSRVVMESVDLTDVSAPEPPKPAKNTHVSKTNSSASTKPNKQKDPAAGPSKNIVVTGSSKNIFLTPSNTLKGGVVRVSNLDTRSDKKRPATKVEVEASKRKKTEPMTLKDFNLDDIDDIIELE